MKIRVLTISIRWKSRQKDLIPVQLKGNHRNIPKHPLQYEVFQPFCSPLEGFLQKAEC